MEDIKSLQLELDALLCGASSAKLTEFMAYLELQGMPEVTSKLHTIKYIQNEIEKRLAEPLNLDFRCVSA